MKKRMFACAIAIAAVAAIPAAADILSVTGPNSSAGQAPQIISAPIALTNQCVTNAGQQGFNENQQVTTTSDWFIDGGGTIPAKTTYVNSHMIFMNQPNSVTAPLTHTNVTWTFDFPIIGVMSDIRGEFEAQSDTDFATPLTDYKVLPTPSPCNTSTATGDSVAPYNERGIEGTDNYIVSGSTMTINISVSQPGDWIRVLTRGKNVAIDIKPGSYPNCFNINGNGVVPVAILGSASLDVTTINTSSLSFNGLAVRIKGNNQNQCSVQDVNADGVPDLVCQFQDNTANWLQGSTLGVVTGQLNDGTLIRGTDSICVQP